MFCIGDWTFVTNIVTLNKENVSLSQNYRWHIHSAGLNLISLLQRMCLKQLCLIRKGCLCCVLLHYQYNSSHKSFYMRPLEDSCHVFLMRSKSCRLLPQQDHICMYVATYLHMYNNMGLWNPCENSDKATASECTFWSQRSMRAVAWGLTVLVIRSIFKTHIETRLARGRLHCLSSQSQNSHSNKEYILPVESFVMVRCLADEQSVQN